MKRLFDWMPRKRNETTDEAYGHMIRLERVIAEMVRVHRESVNDRICDSEFLRFSRDTVNETVAMVHHWAMCYRLANPGKNTEAIDRILAIKLEDGE